uniref:Coiled-coil alpha-helical rod protein 1 n=1 Tax=Latimeria chalumnae TaxID=7897 RepID=H3AZN3_LATCH
TPGEGLNPPSLFTAPKPTVPFSGPGSLMPPSHFESRPYVAAPCREPWRGVLTTQEGGGDPWAELSRASKQLLELRRENQHLWELQRKSERDASRGRTAHPHTSELQAKETEMLGLQDEVRGLRAQLAKAGLEWELEVEKMKLLHQAELERLESQRLAQEERLQAQGRAELEKLEARLSREMEQAQALQAELEQAEEEHQRQLEGLKVEYQRTAKESGKDGQERVNQLQEQLLRVSEVHDSEMARLKQRLDELEQELRQGKEKHRLEVTRLRKELEQVNREGERLKEDVGQLEKERDALNSTAELLNVRLTSLTDMLTIQEVALSKKQPKLGPLEADDPRRKALLTCWREKVFALMVQLRSQEIRHKNDTNQLRTQISGLEHELEAKEQEHSLLLHSLQDKTAELEMDRVKSRTLQAELLEAQDVAVHLQDCADRDVLALQQLKEVVAGFYQTFLGQEAKLNPALSRLLSLEHRVTFACKRIDTIQGLLVRKEALMKLQLQERSREAEFDASRSAPSYEDLEAELQLLHQERDRLSAELKLNSQLIERKIGHAREKFEAELQDQQAVIGQLQQALQDQAEARGQLMHQQLAEAQDQLQEASETTETLRRDLARQQDKYEQALQEKVSEVESRLLQQLSDMEKSLNEARRQHTKAVVALRQAERQASRDKERSQQMLKLQEEAKHLETQRLNKQLQELERDKNLLMVTLRQEGLLNQYRKNRTAALRTTHPEKEELARPLPQSQASRPSSSRLVSSEPLSVVLDDLQALSAAVTRDEEEGDASPEEEEKGRD